MLVTRKLVSGVAALVMAVSGALPTATEIVGRDGSYTSDDGRILSRQSLELCPDEDDTDKVVMLDGLMPKNATAEAVDVTEMIAEQDIVETPLFGDSSVVVAYDITISDAVGEFQPASSRPIYVEIYDPNITDSGNTELWHISDDGQREQIDDFTVENGMVSFYAEGFSVYAIVEGPKPVSIESEKITSIKGLVDHNGGVYIGHIDGYYFKNKTEFKDNRTGIAKTGQSDKPNTEAAVYYFEPVDKDSIDENTTTANFFVYCYDGNGNKQYVYNNKDKNLSFESETKKTEFTLAYSNGQFTVKNGAWYWNMQGGTSGTRFCSWNSTSTDPNIPLYIWTYEPVPDDPYALDGKSYALVNMTSGVSYAVTGDFKTNSITASSAEVKINPLSHTGKDIVVKSVDEENVSQNGSTLLWTFTNTGEDNYTLSAELDGETKYLGVADNNLVFSDTAFDWKVVPDGDGCIKLSSDNYNLGFDSNVFKIKSPSVPLTLAELSPLIPDDYQIYSAEKIGVSEVNNGDSFIVYTRIWNDSEKKYQFYAVAHDGSLVPCYERGDDIMWIGSRINTLVWDFTEYYGSDGLVNNYYELYNPYSGKYIAPQINGQVLSDEKIGLNLPGRRDGEYYTDILAWDDPHYAYAALEGVVANGSGRLESCTRREARSFYFAKLKDAASGLTEVETIDNDEYGITMKMVDFGGATYSNSTMGCTTTQKQHDVMGNSNYIDNGAGLTGLVSTDLDADGYPVATETNKSLSELFASATKVNHLFIHSTYEASGYFEYDSCQNFATLKETNDGNFTVFKELGSMDGSSKESMKHGQFMPYNKIVPDQFITNNNPLNLYDAEKKPLFESDPRKYEKLYKVSNPNHYFGMEVDAGFVQTPNGKDNWGHDIIFEFTGDDDFWLYVDDELIIDLGGIHGALAGNVNFATGEVVSNGKTSSLKALFYDNYIKRGHSEAEAEAYVDGLFVQKDNGAWVFNDYSKHTMKIFYMERGGGASNLHMRFNLSYVTPGHVLLKKEVANAGDLDLSLVQYPYQIYYKEKDDPNEYLLANTDRNVNVTYQNSTQKVEFRSSYTPPGCSQAINNVYFLNPEQVAEIHFPSDTMEYRIVECGISAGEDGVYKTVSLKGETEPLSGTELAGETVVKRYSYDSGWRAVSDHTSTIFVNEVNEKALRPLYITKKLYDESGRELTYNDSANGTGGEEGNANNNDNTLFQFRLYLTNGADDELRLANMAKYRVKNASGYYCKWEVYDPQPEDPSAPKGHFVSTGRNDFSQLSAEEKERSTFETSINGTIAQIPAGYTVEVPNLTAGVRFKVVERPNETELGYGKVRYEREVGTYIKNESDNDGTVFKDVQPIMRVINKRGYGLEVAKKWSDADFVYDHDPIYIAVYESGSGTPLLADGKTTVREISPQNLKVRYFFDGITDDDFDGYSVHEVELIPKNGTSKVKCDDDFVVTNIDEFDIVKADDGTLNSARRMQTPGVYDPANEGKEPFSYFPTTIKGEAVKVNDQATGKKRTDTVKNTRKGGVIISLHDMADGTPLGGGEFTITRDDGKTIGTFTSDADGQITILFKEDNLDLSKTYTITQTKAPKGYIGVPEPVEVSFAVEGDSVTAVNVTGNDSQWADGGVKSNDAENLIGYIKLYNKRTELTVRKVDSFTGRPVQGAHFALYKCVNGVKDYKCMEGYSDIVSGPDGVIDEITVALPHGTYCLEETEAPSGYIRRSEDVRFTISSAGGVTAASFLTKTDGDVCTYVLSIPNEPTETTHSFIIPTGIRTGHAAAATALLLLSAFGVLLMIHINKRERE